MTSTQSSAGDMTTRANATERFNRRGVARLAALAALLVVATIGGQSTLSIVFQIKGDSTELSGAADGSVVVPAVGPLGTLRVKGTGAAEFGPVAAGTGVAFR